MVGQERRGLSPSHGRQIRLLVRLLEAEYPLSADEIFLSVNEYRERYEANSGRDAALEKLFERDRAALRITGVEIESVPDPEAPGDKARWRYRIRQDAAGGASVELTAEEMLLVGEAADAWIDPELRSGARTAYVKLLGTGESGAVPPASAPRTVLSTHPNFAALRDAVAQQSRVEFEYLKHRGEAREIRDVDALRLYVHRGRWLLFGYDHRRQAERNFLLSRISSSVTVTGSHERVLSPSRDLLGELDAFAQQNPVRLRVRANSEAAARLTTRGTVVTERTGDPDWQAIDLCDWDLGLLADEIAGLGSQVVVISPPEFLADVRERIELMLRLHELEGQS